MIIDSTNKYNENGTWVTHTIKSYPMMDYFEPIREKRKLKILVKRINKALRR